VSAEIVSIIYRAENKTMAHYNTPLPVTEELGVQFVV
jgi:hypothetical protein